jgi:hypothetical protein
MTALLTLSDKSTAVATMAAHSLGLRAPCGSDWPRSHRPTVPAEHQSVRAAAARLGWLRVRHAISMVGNRAAPAILFILSRPVLASQWLFPPS